MFDKAPRFFSLKSFLPVFIFFISFLFYSDAKAGCYFDWYCSTGCDTWPTATSGTGGPYAFRPDCEAASGNAISNSGNTIGSSDCYCDEQKPGLESSTPGYSSNYYQQKQKQRQKQQQEQREEELRKQEESARKKREFEKGKAETIKGIKGFDAGLKEMGLKQLPSR